LRKCRIVKVIAARTLQKIAADGCHVAQLWTRPREQRLA
jgi:hypothetical protein